jgi:hypothetical protein
VIATMPPSGSGDDAGPRCERNRGVLLRRQCLIAGLHRFALAYLRGARKEAGNSLIYF